MVDLDPQRKDRGAKANRTAVWGLIYQIVYAGTQLCALGMLVRYVGTEQYGLWMTVLALTTWMPLLMLGQHGTLLTKLGATALTDSPAGRRFFSASVLLVTIPVAGLLVALALTGSLIPWGRVLNAGGVAIDSAVAATAVAALMVSLVSLPALLGGYSIFAHQRGDLVHSVMSVGSLVSLAATGVGIWLRLPLWFVGALTLTGPLLGGVALWAFGLASALVPRPRLADRETLRVMMASGFLFLLVDATTLLLLRTPDVIVAQLHGVDAVGPFASVGRFPLLMLAVFQAVLLPFWPALGEASFGGDQEWVRRIAVRTLAVVLGIWAAGATGIWYLGPMLVRIWMGSSDFAQSDLLAAACMQSLGLGLFSWVSVLLGALSLQRVLVLASGLAALVFVPMAVLFGVRFGPVGVALAQACALLFCAIPASGAILYRKLVHRIPEPLAF